MKNVLRLEELGMFLTSFLLFLQMDIAWWWFLILLLLPDVSMIGYLLGNKTGAILYNIFHHKGIAFLLMVSGYYLDLDILYISGIMLFAHASMDRIFGYGLKYQSGFKFTHLGEIGKF